MLLLILAQIVARGFGLLIPSSEDFAGWLLAAIIFFGLAYTFQQGGHIKMTLVLHRVKPALKWYLHVINSVAALLLVGFFFYYAVATVYEAYYYSDVTDTYIVLPLWILQLPMALGVLFLWLAIFDDFIIFMQNKGTILNSND